MIGLSELPEIDEVRDACSNLVRSEQAIMRQRQRVSSKLAMSKDYSCEPIPPERGLRLLSDEKPIALMLNRYWYQGVPCAAGERASGERIFAS